MRYPSNINIFTYPPFLTEENDEARLGNIFLEKERRKKSTEGGGGGGRGGGVELGRCVRVEVAVLGSRPE